MMIFAKNFMSAVTNTSNVKEYLTVCLKRSNLQSNINIQWTEETELNKQILFQHLT